MLMPVLVLAFGPVEAVPIMTIAAILANLGRILAWWREVDWRACAAYAATGAPCAALGALTLLALPARIIEAALGAFFLAMVPVRRALALRPAHLAGAGVPIGYLTGIAVSTGPITAPLFLAAGLAKGAFLGTEAAATLAVYLAKAAVFRGFGALPLDILLKGLATGSTLTAGAFLARRFVIRMSAERFRRVMEALMLVSGTVLLAAAAFGE